MNEGALIRVRYYEGNHKKTDEPQWSAWHHGIFVIDPVKGWKQEWWGSKRDIAKAEPVEEFWCIENRKFCGFMPRIDQVEVINENDNRN